MARLRTRLGFLMMSVVMLPAAMNLFDGVSGVDAIHRPRMYLRCEILRDPWPVRLSCIHGLESSNQSVGDLPNGERRSVDGGERGPSRLST